MNVPEFRAWKVHTDIVPLYLRTLWRYTNAVIIIIIIIYFLYSFDLDLDLMTLICKPDLDILKMHLHT